MLDTIRAMSAFELAGLAECLSPDDLNSPGAVFLTRVRDAVVEAIESGESLSEARRQIADDAPNVYTHARWAEFVDLGAYLEENEIGDGWGDDLTAAAGVALHQIAARLCDALAQRWQERDDADTDAETVDA